MGTFLFTEEAQAVTTAVRLTPFQDALPIPPVHTGASHSLTINQTTHHFHSALGTVPVWGYNGGAKTDGYLGPTIVAQKGTPTTVAQPEIMQFQVQGQPPATDVTLPT